MRRVDTIKKVVAEYFRTSVDALDGPRRDPQYVKPRHIAMYLCLKHTDMKKAEIAWNFNKENSIMRFAIKAIEDALKVSPEMRENVKSIESKLPWINQ